MNSPNRLVVDHHVNRLGVEARQRVELTSTNQSNGFFKMSVRSAGMFAHSFQLSRGLSPWGVQRIPGGHSEGVPPDPIPNSEVKTFSADDTASQGVGK